MTAREVSSERVSEERLDSFIKRCDDMSEDGQFSWWAELTSILRDYLALRSSVKTVGVKKLEWRVLTEGFSLQRAETTLGDYRIWREVSGAWFWSLYDGKYSGGSEDKEDQAKAAAQADYERRILSAIEAPSEGEAVKIGYTNWRGEYAEREIVPMRPWFGSTEWHPEPQWLLKAWDVAKGAERDFAIKDIGFRPSPAAPSEVTEEMRDWSSDAERQAVEAGQLAAFEYSRSGGGPIGVFTEGLRAYRAALTAALKGDRP